jgi:NAD(P)-dependent dehydrogenase (short-subunit alcohol dehydrogenase family)
MTKTAIITGANKGIGLAVAKNLIAPVMIAVFVIV